MKVQYFKKLGELKQINPATIAVLDPVSAKFSFRTNSYYNSLIDWDDPDDPLKKLIMPDLQELNDNLASDSLNEIKYHDIPGIQYKYGDQINLLVTSTCAAICRYCFRKNLLHQGNTITATEMSKVREWLEAHPDVKSVVVTGGEPLILSTSRLNSILTTLQEVESVEHIRISAKICSFNPYRILDDPGLLKMFRERCQARLGNTIWIGNHFSHPKEFTDSSREAVRLLKATGVGMLNNVPIVRGINADPDILASVFSGVYEMGISNYYACVLTETEGNKALTLPLEEISRIYLAARKKVPGSAKTARLTIKRERGNVSVLGVSESRIYFELIHSEYKDQEGKIFSFKSNPDAYFLEDYDEVKEGAYDWI
jgi:lysine 2,3-aminomutase